MLTQNQTDSNASLIVSRDVADEVAERAATALATVPDLARHLRTAADALERQGATIIGLHMKIDELKEALENPPKHKFWGAGEKDCPREIKASNGELHTLRCKVCGLDRPRDEICRAQVSA